jgi:hypothetical protein
MVSTDFLARSRASVNGFIRRPYQLAASNTEPPFRSDDLEGALLRLGSGALRRVVAKRDIPLSGVNRSIIHVNSGRCSGDLDYFGLARRVLHV